MAAARLVLTFTDIYYSQQSGQLTVVVVACSKSSEDRYSSTERSCSLLETSVADLVSMQDDSSGPVNQR